MANHEQLQELITNKFNTAIYGLRDANIPGVSEIADRFVARIRDQELLVVGKTPAAVCPSVTGFDLGVVRPIPHLLLRPTIVIDMGKVLESSNETMQADLIRSLAIADTFPDKGYEHRLHRVYANALEVQKTWLETHDVKRLTFDPREREQEEMLPHLMGQRRYYTDFGIDDWRAACDKVVDDPKMQKHAAALRNSVGQVITMRQEYTKFMYQESLRRGGDFSKKTADERAELMATAMVGMTLTSLGFKSNT